MNSKIWWGIPFVIAGMFFSWLGFWIFKTRKDPDEMVIAMVSVFGICLFAFGWKLIGEGLGLGGPEMDKWLK